MLATKNLTGKLRSDAKIIWVPNTFFDGYFPQYIKNNHDLETDKQGYIRFPGGDKYIDEIMELSGMNPDVEKILDTISNENFIPADEIQTRSEKSLNELKNREWICDIKMSDYVEENYRDQQLFYSPNHPIPTVVFELARRVLKYLDIRSDNYFDFKAMFNEEHLFWSLIGQDIPIYPAVKKFFKFEKCLDQYYANVYMWKFRANFRDFMRQYILTCWHERFSQ